MNYMEHIEELDGRDPGEIVLFIKPNSAISDQLMVPLATSRFEGELCFIVRDGVPAGIGFGLDLTLSEVQKSLKVKGLPWEKSKAFDGAAVFSPFVSFSGNFEGIRLELWINGGLRQRGSVDLMIYKPREILEEMDNVWAAWGWAVERGQVETISNCVGALGYVGEVRGWYQEVDRALEEAASILRLQLMQIEAHTRFYSPFNVIKKLFRNNIAAFIIGIYAHKLNQQWQKIERHYLSSLKSLARQALAIARAKRKTAEARRTT